MHTEKADFNNPNMCQSCGLNWVDPSIDNQCYPCRKDDKPIRPSLRKVVQDHCKKVIPPFDGLLDHMSTEFLGKVEMASEILNIIKEYEDEKG